MLSICGVPFEIDLRYVDQPVIETNIISMKNSAKQWQTMAGKRFRISKTPKKNIPLSVPESDVLFRVAAKFTECSTIDRIASILANVIGEEVVDEESQIVGHFQLQK